MSESSKALFEILAPPQWTVPIVCNSPHSGHSLPDHFLKLTHLPAELLHTSEDSHVDTLFSGCVELGVPLLRALVSRSYLDLNREPFELDARMFVERLPSHMNTTSPRVACGLGTIPKIVAENQNIYSRPLLLADALQRIDSIHRPYHRALAALLDEAHSCTGQILLLDCHSMPSSAARMGSGAWGEPHIDVALGDRHGSSCDPSIVKFAEHYLKSAGLNVHRNKPYAGGYITEIHGKPRYGRHALQIEINRALYMNETTREPTAEFKELAQLIDNMIINLKELIAPWIEEAPFEQAAE